MRVALAAARETADGLRARLVVALGDMLELGALAPAMHAEAISDLYRVRPDAAVAVGPEFAAAVRALTTARTASNPDPASFSQPLDNPAAPPARAALLAPPIRLAPSPPIQLAPDSAAAAAIVRALIRPGNVLLVKGSRGIAMERAIYGLAR